MAIRTKGNPIYIAIVLLIAGLVMFISNVGDVTRLQSPMTEFDTLLKDDFKEGDIVQGSAKYTLGCIAEEYVERNGIRYGSGSNSLYYIIPSCEEDFLVVKVEKSLFESMDRLYEQTVLMLDSGESTIDPVPFNGKLVKTDSQVEGWFYEYMEAIGASKAEIDKYTIHYTVDCKNWDTVYTMFYIGLGLIVISAVIIVVAIIMAKARSRSFTPVNSTLEMDNAIARGDMQSNAYDWNASVPSSNQVLRDDIAPPPTPGSDEMSSVVVPKNNTISATAPSYGGYSAPGSAPAPVTTPVKPVVTDISGDTSPEVVDAFADLQNDAMKSFADLSNASKDSFDEFNKK